MHRPTIFCFIAVLLTLTEYAVGLDMTTVRLILDKCGFDTMQVEDVADFNEEGRVIRFNLTNPDIAKDGIMKLPQEIGELTELRKFICIGNSIIEIPTVIGKCTELRELNLASNRIVAVPPEIGALRELRKLDLRHNSIALLPPEIGTCENLEYLWLWGNKLIELDPAIVRLRKLRELYLNDNRLTTLPLGIMGMRLNYIDFMGNRLCDISTVLHLWCKKIDGQYKSTQRCH
jgi:Leucine-rich repeat (LRR) protein